MMLPKLSNSGLSTGRFWGGFLTWVVLALVACGGGVEVGGTGSGQSSYTEGAITGYGSIVVNSVHFDESSATVQDEDGQTLGATGLQLGMQVRIDSGSIDTSALSATASKVVVVSDLLGPVSANDVANSQLTVLGQTVKISSSTVWASGLQGGQSALTLGRVVEVFAVFDPVRQLYTASRIDLPSTTPSSYRMRGPVAALNTSAGTFRIGAALLHYSSNTQPNNLVEGQWLRVSLAPQADAQGRWTLQTSAAGRNQAADGRKVQLEGVVASLSSASLFSVAGQAVQASAATVSPAGTVLVAGMRVQVQGQMQAGVLVASQLQIKDADDDGEDDEAQNFEFKGDISALDTQAGTLTLRGAVIAYTQASFEPSGSSASGLRVGRRVEVRGQLGSNGSTFVAERVKFTD